MCTGRATGTDVAARVLFSAPPEHWPLWRPHLLAAFAAAGLDVALTDDPAGPWTFDYVVYQPGGPVDRLHPLHPAEGGAEPLGRGRGDRRRPDAHRAALPHGRCRAHPRAWSNGSPATCCATTSGSTRISSARTASGGNGVVPPLAAERTVGVLGLGEIGRAVALALAGLGFDVRGWSRRPRELPGVATFTRRRRPRRAARAAPTSSSRSCRRRPAPRTCSMPAPGAAAARARA